MRHLIIPFLLFCSSNIYSQHCAASYSTCIDEKANKDYLDFVCIDGGDGLLTSYDGNSPLLDEPAASSTPQFVVIKRDITINENYTFAAGSKILVLPGKKITINSGYRLRLFETQVFSCSSSWNGFYVNSGGTLFVKDGSIIQDANVAIEPQANASVIVTGSAIENNTVGVNAVNGNFKHFFLYNTFDGNSTASAFHAFRIYSNTRVNCTGGYIQNFRGTDDNTESVLIQERSSFYGNQINFDNNGVDISVPDGESATLVSLAGCNFKNSNQVAVFNNIINYANFNNCNIDNISIGLNRSAIFGTRINRFGCEYSSFSNFDGKGIDINLSNGMKGGIKGNYFTSDYHNGEFFPVIGVRLSSSIYDIVQDTLINNYGDMHGISIQGSNSYNIGHNLIDYQIAPSSPLSRGISITSWLDNNLTTTSNGLRIHDNAILGQSGANNTMYGIYIQNSSETDISCNTINRILDGVAVLGNCGLTIRSNSLNNYRNGIHIFSNSYSGLQNNNMNSFLVNSNPSGTYDILCQGDPLLSIFKQQYTSYPYWPDAVNTNDVRIQGGTERSSSCQSPPDVPPVYCCPNLLGNPRNIELMDGTFSPVTGESGKEWHEKYMIYSYFMNHEDEIDDDSVYENYVDSIQNYSNITDFYRIISGIDTLFAINPDLSDTLDNLHARIETAYLQIDTITLSRGSTPSEAQIDTILGLKLSIENGLDTLEENYQFLFDSLSELKSLQLDSFQAILTSITPDNTIESDLKKVLKVYLDILSVDESTLTEAQVDTLETVSEKCYSTFGIGVTISRALLNVADDLDANCEESIIASAKDIHKKNKLITIKRNDNGMIIGNLSANNGLLKIVTLDGKILFSELLNGNKEIEIKSEMFNLYRNIIFITFKSDNGNQETLSFFK